MAINTNYQPAGGPPVVNGEEIENKLRLAAFGVQHAPGNMNISTDDSAHFYANST